MNKTLINFSTVSMILTGNRTQITKDYDGKKYKSKIDQIRKKELEIIKILKS